MLVRFLCALALSVILHWALYKTPIEWVMALPIGFRSLVGAYTYVVMMGGPIFWVIGTVVGAIVLFVAWCIVAKCAASIWGSPQRGS